MKRKFLDSETYKTYLGALEQESLDDISILLEEKSFSSDTFRKSKSKRKHGFFDNLSKILQRNNETKKKN